MCIRVEQLEEQMGASQQGLKTAQADLTAARNDNVRLYEKVRYLHRYAARQGSADAASNPAAFNFVKVDDADDLVLPNHVRES